MFGIMVHGCCPWGVMYDKHFAILKVEEVAQELVGVHVLKVQAL
jgi:hypothetical protein